MCKSYYEICFIHLQVCTVTSALQKNSPVPPTALTVRFSCTVFKISAQYFVQPPSFCKGRLASDYPGCVQGRLRVCSRLRWTDRSSVETMARQVSRMARTTRQIGGVEAHIQTRPLHPNLGRRSSLPNAVACFDWLI